jgi:hypothetical protein
MTPDDLKVKMRQCMKPGMPHYLRDLHLSSGMYVNWSDATMERRLRDVDCVYFVNEKLEGRKKKEKIYYIKSLPVAPCPFLGVRKFIGELNSWLKSWILKVGLKGKQNTQQQND